MSFLKNLIIACSLLSSVESRPVSPIIPVAVAAAPFLAGAALCTLGYKNLTVYETPAQETGKPASFRPMTLEEALGAYFGGFIIGIIPGVNIAGFLHILNIDGARERGFDTVQKTGISMGLLTYVSIAKALVLAGIIKEVTYTTTHTKWALA